MKQKPDHKSANSRTRQSGTAFFGPSQSVDHQSFFHYGVQPKLRVSQPNDPHEREAESMADQVVSRLASPFFSPLPTISRVQRQAAPEEEMQTFRQEEEEAQAFRQEEEEAQAFRQEEEEAQTFRQDEEEAQAFRQEEEEAQTFRQEEEEAQTFRQEEEEAQAFRQEEEEPPAFRQEEEEAQTFRQAEEEEAMQASRQTEGEEDTAQLARQAEPAEEELATAPEEEEQAARASPIHLHRQTGPPAPPTIHRQRFGGQGGGKPHRFTLSPTTPLAHHQVQRRRRRHVQRRRRIQANSARAPPDPGPGFQSHLRSSKGAGSALPERTRSPMESAFQADFSNVRVHTDSRAVGMSQAIQAQAFTHGSDIYFNRGRFNPSTSGGQHLLAHELTHVVQQGEAMRRRPQVTRAPPSLQRLPWGIGDKLNKYARHIPGYTLITVLVGYNPLTDRAVAKTPHNILEGLMGLVPFGTALFDKLNELGIVDAAFNWVNERLAALDLNLARVERLIEIAWDRTDFVRLDPFAYNKRVLIETFTPLVNDIKTFASQAADKILELIKEALISALRALAEAVPGYKLLTMILHKDPLADTPVEATTAQIIEEFLTLIGATAELEKMKEHGALERTAAWIDEQLALLNFSFEEIKGLFATAWNSFSFNDVADPVGAFNRTIAIFTPFATRVWNFASNVASAVLQFIKDALLGWLSSFAEAVPGFHLLTVIIGFNPFTGQAVPRTASNFIRGFLSFVPGGEEKYRNLQESGAIDRAMAWLNEQILTLNLSFEMLKALFLQAWNGFSITDLLAPLEAFGRIIDIFRPPVSRILRFAAAVGMKILEFIFEGVMGAGGARVLAILKRGRDTFLTIVRNPVGFLGNLLNALALGFQQFSTNILKHLKAGLVGWLLGSLEGAGLQLPQTFDLMGIISLVLQILGLTYDRIRPKLVKLLGERVVGVLETTFGFLKTLVTEGPGAAWKEIVGFVQGNLKEIVMGAIRNWVVTKVVTAAVTKLATMFNPVGAVVQAIITVYNTVMFFIERINQIMALVNSVIESIAAIAAGDLAAAANFVEQSMARTIPVIISFLARLMGLGGISEKIREIIEKIRGTVDKAIDKLVAWIGKQVKRLVKGGKALVAKGKAAVAGVFAWWKARKSFRTPSGEQHSLFFEGQGENAQLMVASRRRRFTAAMQEISIASNDPKKADKERAKAEALRIAGEIDRTRKRTRDENNATVEPEAFQRLMEQLGTQLAIFMDAAANEVPVSSPPSYGGLNNGFGTSMHVTRLTHLGPPGSGPGSTINDHWRVLRWRLAGGGSYYVRGHLLNDNVHGPGTTWQNLTPLTQEANNRGAGSHLHKIETDVKRVVNQEKRIVDYRVTANYGRSLNTGLLAHFRDPDNADPKKERKAQIVEKEGLIPTSLTCTARQVNADGTPAADGLNKSVSIDNSIDQGPDSYSVRGG